MRCAITALAELLARKQQLLERLQADPDPQERDEIERLLGEIKLTLEVLDEPGESRSEP
jgi:ribosome-binding protein aMBF1 (putative translation factor)